MLITSPYRKDNKSLKHTPIPARYGMSSVISAVCLFALLLAGHALIVMPSDRTPCLISLGGTGPNETNLQSEMILYKANENVFKTRYDAPMSKQASACGDDETGDIFS
jgi:hypothetical protein